MDYKLIIVKEAGDLSAELQTADQGHRQAFNIYDVIGDYKKIKRVEHGKRGRPKTYFDLQNHVFGCMTLLGWNFAMKMCGSRFNF